MLNAKATTDVITAPNDANDFFNSLPSILECDIIPIITDKPVNITPIAIIAGPIFSKVD